MNMKSLLLVILFLFFAIEDQRKRSIPLWWLATGFAPGTIFYLSGAWMMEPDIILGIFSGGLFLLVCAFSRGKMGMADGIAAVMTGFYLGGIRLLQILFFAFLSGGITAGLLLLTRKKKLQDEMPMLPFYFLAMVLQLYFFRGEQGGR